MTQCAAKTIRGIRCKNDAVAGSKYCHKHSSYQLKRLLAIIGSIVTFFVGCCGCIASTVEILDYLKINPLVSSETPRTKTPKPPSREYGGIDSPYPVGMAAKLYRTDDNGIQVPFLFLIEEIVRGNDVMQYVEPDDIFTMERIRNLPTDLEVILVRFTVKNVSDHNLLEFYNPSFEIITNGEVFKDSDFSLDGSFYVNHLNFFKLEILPGMESSSWMVRPVYKNDLNPLLATGNTADIRYGIYFSLTP